MFISPCFWGFAAGRAGFLSRMWSLLIYCSIRTLTQAQNWWSQCVKMKLDFWLSDYFVQVSGEVWPQRNKLSWFFYLQDLEKTGRRPWLGSLWRPNQYQRWGGKEMEVGVLVSDEGYLNQSVQAAGGSGRSLPSSSSSPSLISNCGFLWNECWRLFHWFNNICGACRSIRENHILSFWRSSSFSLWLPGLDRLLQETSGKETLICSISLS